MIDIGDVVEIVDLHQFNENDGPGIVSEMYRYIGEVFAVKEISRYHTGRVHEFGYWWDPEWLAEVDEQPTAAPDLSELF